MMDQEPEATRIMHEPDLSSCPSEDSIAALLSRGLPDDSRGALHQHLETCPQCTALFLALVPSQQSQHAEIGSAPSPPPESSLPSIGSTLGQRFHLLRVLGRGASSVVYEADDLLRRERVALKLLRSPQPSLLRQFKQEFRTVHDLRQRNIVRLFDLFTDAGHWWFTMECVDGVDLLSYVRADRGTAPIGQQATRYDEARLRDALKQLLAGLSALHTAGLIHRDIKPKNVVVSSNGRVVILDLGLAQSVGQTSRQATGTPGYMAPEQKLGCRASAASDLYSVGVLLHEALYGYRPRSDASTDRPEHDPPETKTEPQSEPQHPSDLVDLCSILLSADPMRRLRYAEMQPGFGPLLKEPAPGDEHRDSERFLDIIWSTLPDERSAGIAVLGLHGSIATQRRMLLHCATRLPQRHRALTLLWGYGSVHEHAPFAMLDSLLDSLAAAVDTWPVGELRSTLTRDAAVLGNLSPVMARLLDRCQLRVADERLTHSALYRAALVLLRQLAARGPLIVAVQNADQADAQSLAILRSLCETRPGASLLLLLGTEDRDRLEHLPHAPHVTQWLNEPEPDPDLASAPAIEFSPADPPLRTLLAIDVSRGLGTQEHRTLHSEILRCGLQLDLAIGGVLFCSVQDNRTWTALEQVNLAFRGASALANLGLRVAVASSRGPGFADAVAAARGMLASTQGDPIAGPPGTWVMDALTSNLAGCCRDLDARVLGRTTPFVGRKTELTWLDACYADCTDHRRANVVLIKAEAGAGKSRLWIEWLRRNESLLTRTLLLRADPMDPGAALRVLGSGLRRYLGFPDAADIAPGRDHSFLQLLQARLADRLPPPDVDRVSQFLCEICQVPLPNDQSARLRAARADAVTMAAQLRQAFVDFLRTESAGRPFVIVVDNLQWLDASTKRFLAEALRQLQNDPLLLVATARPDLPIGSLDSWLERSLRVHDLAPLDPDSARQLVLFALPDSSTAPQVDAMVQRSAGNVLFLEELIRAAAAGEDSPHPESVLTIVQARQQRLPAPCRRALQAASVYGEQFELAALAALLGYRASPSSCEPLLRVLEATEWIERQAEEGCYRFRHSLLREAAYDLLPASQRKQDHLAAAEFLAANPGSDSLRIAEQFERGGDPKRAAHYYARAAERLLWVGDLDRAIKNADCVLEHTDSSEDRLAALSVLMDAHGWRQEFDKADQYARALNDLAPAGSLPWINSQIWQHFLAHHRGDSFAQQAAHQRLLRTTPAYDAIEKFAYALGGSTFMMLMAGQTGQAKDALHVMEDVLSRAAAQDPLAEAWLQNCHSYFRSWCEEDPFAGLRCGQHALGNFDRFGYALGVQISRYFVGCCHWLLGQHAEAAQALSGNAFGGFQQMQPAVLAVVLLDLDRTLEAANVIEALLQAAEHGPPQFEWWARWAQADLLLRQGHLDAAERAAQRACSLLRFLVQQRLPVDALLAEIWLRQGRTQEALDHAQATYQELRRIGTLGYGGVRAERVLIDALLAAGQIEEAHVQIRSAAQRALRSAARIQDPAARSSFLLNIPDRARILRLANELPADPPA